MSSAVNEKIFEIINAYPDLEIAEVMQSAANSYFQQPNKNLSDITSKELLKALEHFKNELALRNNKVVPKKSR